MTHHYPSSLSGILTEYIPSEYLHTARQRAALLRFLNEAPTNWFSTEFRTDTAREVVRLTERMEQLWESND